jgi:solute carrier family 25 protein 39/40
MSKLVKTKGLTILWRGLGPTLWRDVPFSGLYWAGFEILKTRFASTHPDLSPLTTSFISGALSGTFSALLTQPFDVLKTRRQVFTPSPHCSPAALNSHASTIPLAMHVIKTEGFGALMAGLTARCGKVAPACGLMIASYEGVGRWLSGGDRGL